VRELLSGIYKDLLEPDEIESVAMAAHELLENVVKYSADGTSSFDVDISDRDGGAFVRLRTRNRADARHLDAIRRVLERVASASDPMLIYDELVASSPRREGSGLGLARICAEGDMDVSCTLQDGHVMIVAERRVSVQRSA